MTASVQQNCPITGAPPVRLIQRIPSRLLVALWRYTLLVDVRPQLRDIPRFSLWESPCGLAYFDPMIAGDQAFYDALYGRLGESGPWTSHAIERTDYARAAALVKAGSKVLDVGCGPAGFSRHVTHAHYVGLDQSPRTAKVPADVRCETIAQHANVHAGEYDVVCSFHVLEHVVRPLAFVEEMLRCLRPGGYLVLAVPSWPSAMTDIPNLAANGPPHHLTWWTERALRALAERFQLEVEAAETLQPSRGLALAYWMARVAPKLTGQRFFRHAWSWHLGLLWSWLAGRLCYTLLGMPAGAHSLELLLVARKP
jgi:SAM-dependent methyltransferase